MVFRISQEKIFTQQLFFENVLQFNLDGLSGRSRWHLLGKILLFQVKRSRSKGGLAGPDGMKSVFGQVCGKMSAFGPDSLMLPHRVWKVKFIGSYLVWQKNICLKQQLRTLRD